MTTVYVTSQLFVYSPSVDMPIYDIPSAALPALLFAINFVPDGISSQFEKVAAYLRTYCEDQPEVLSTPEVQVSLNKKP